MGAREIANELERFRSDISEYEQAYNSINSKYQEMFSQIKELDSMWAGEAHNAFMTQFGQDAENMEDVLQYLQELLRDLQFACREYTNCERAVNDVVNSMRL